MRSAAGNLASSTGARGEPAVSFDVERVRADFPILAQEIHGKPLVYLDNAASSHKPRQVIEAVAHFDSHDYSNIHRGVHDLSQRATAAYEAARDKAQKFLNAADRKEIIFVRGTTEAINLVAHSYGRTVLNLGDEILISTMEHHSNIVPWQMVCRERGAVLRVIPINDNGELLLDEYEKLVGPRTRLVSVVARLQRPRHHQPDSRDGRDCPSPRRSGSRRRRAGRSAHAGRRAGTGLRLLRLLGPQALRADRRRRSSTGGPTFSSLFRLTRVAAR